jgi:acetyltransferase
MRLIGPNCAGIMNTGSRLSASIELPARPGRIGFITQSGAVGGAVLSLADARGIGFSKFVSYGNRADLGEAELLEYLAEDPETAVIAMYLESVTDGVRLLPVLAAAAAAKPVIAIKAGRTEAGRRAAGSHTGALAGADEVFAAAFRKTAVIRAAGIEELLDLCNAFCSLPPMRGRNLAIVTNSGGPGILAADRAEELALSTAEPGPELRRSLGEFLSDRCALGNPVDLTVEGSAAAFERTLRLMLEGGYDGAIAINVATPFLDSVELARGVIAARAALKHGKPIIASFITGNQAAEELKLLQQAGVPCFVSGERAAVALARLREREELLAASRRAPVGPPPEPRRLPWPSTQSPAAWASEPLAWAFLCGLGLPFPVFRFCRSPAEASEAGRALRFPLVMKVVASEVLHKSDRGGVVLGLQDASQVRRAFSDLAARFASASFQGVLLAEQIAGGLEVIVAMLAELKSAPLLAGFRGAPPRDRRALAALIARLSLLALEYPDIGELDLNPVLVLPEGQGVRIADVRIHARL